MALNKSNVIKLDQQRKVRAYAARMKAMTEPKKQYRVLFEGREIARCYIEEAATKYGFGYTFEPV